MPFSLILLGLVEAGLFFTSMYLGAWIRYIDLWTNLGHYGQILPIYPKALVFTFVMIGIMTAFGMYQRDAHEADWSYYARFMSVFIVGMVVMTMVFYLFPSLFLGRGIFAITFILAWVGCGIVRFVFIKFIDHNTLKRRILVLGTGRCAASVSNLENSGKFRFKVVGFLQFGNEARGNVPENLMLDKDRSINEIARMNEIDEIIIGVSDRRSANLPMHELLECKLQGLKVTDMTSFFERETGHVSLQDLNPSWMVFSDGFRRGTVKDIFKRLFDVTFSAVLLFMTLPIIVFTAILIVIESGLPIFYRQQRVGESGKKFDILKFRSMRKDAEKDGKPMWASRNDTRTTRIGHIIRRTRIDELPQIINVLKGDMSFVGPRPERPFFVEELGQKINYYEYRHTVKPGITGWAQIRYPYGASFEDAIEKLQYDLYYIKNHSIFLDFIVMFQTAQVILLGRGAR